MVTLFRPEDRKTLFRVFVVAPAAIFGPIIVTTLVLGSRNCGQAEREADRAYTLLQPGMTMADVINATMGHLEVESWPMRRARLLVASGYPCEYWITLHFGEDGRLERAEKPDLVDIGDSSSTLDHEMPQNNRMQLTAPRVGRAGNGVKGAAAACSPFGEHRRRS